MVATGILAADERVELIEGQLYRMAAKGTAHSAAVTPIGRVLSRLLAGRALLRLRWGSFCDWVRSDQSKT
jgi:Uma2 family endonuclease